MRIKMRENLEHGPGKIRTCTCGLWGIRPPCYLTLPAPRWPRSCQLFGLGSEWLIAKARTKPPPRQMRAPLRKDA